MQYFAWRGAFPIGSAYTFTPRTLPQSIECMKARPPISTTVGWPSPGSFVLFANTYHTLLVRSEAIGLALLVPAVSFACSLTLTLSVCMLVCSQSYATRFVFIRRITRIGSTTSIHCIGRIGGLGSIDSYRSSAT